MKMMMSKLPLKRLSNCIRVLTADAVEKASSGHPGMPLGFADVFTILVLEFLKFDPTRPRHPYRDRVVLSAGHGSMLLYAFYYLVGYKGFTLDDIKNFRQIHSKTPGHPEYGMYEAIETTTGPLAQGFATSVGLALAAKKSHSQHKIYTIVGDGCLMEGLAYEASSLAGHLCLNNLIVLFDDNRITIDGSTDLAVSENHLQKFEALGFSVEQIDGHNFDEIRGALARAQKASKPYFIACRTVIGCGAPRKSGSEGAHGAPLGKEEVSGLKKACGFKDEPFFIPDDLLTIWRSVGVASDLGSDNMVCNDLEPPNVLTVLESMYTKRTDLAEATRISSGKILAKLMTQYPQILSGSADLSFSNNVKFQESKVVTRNNYDGNFIHYGAREAAMSAIMNGLALEGYIPVGGTFLVFSDYMRPGIRLSCIMNLKVIYVMTHDSIGVGEDGPTHQPIEHLANLRAIPNLTILRPADFVETLESWEIAMHSSSPVMLLLTRQSVPQIRKPMEYNQCKFGAYVVDDAHDPDVTIFASGSELQIAIEVKALLQDTLTIRIVSVPSFELLFKQPQEYVDNLLGGDDLKVGIEAASSFGWHRIIGSNGLFFGIDQFGHSAPSRDLYKLYDLESSTIANKIKMRLL
jgi:transketolase